MGMDKKSMPHEKVNNHPYDGMVECLRLIGDLMHPCLSDTSKCDHCQQKIKEYGFTPESWAGYREFMKQYDPSLSYSTIMPKILMRMPVWDKTQNQLLGFLDRQTGQMEPIQKPLTSSVASWIKKNCKL